MIRLLVLLLVLPVASTADVLVRTAEHAGFTRVVVDFGSRQSWKLDRFSNGFRLRTKDAQTYDLNDVYRRINDRRISRIRQEGADLVVETGCDCSARTNVFNGHGLILDIVDAMDTDAEQLEPPMIQAVEDRVTSDRGAPITPKGSLRAEPHLLPGLLTDLIGTRPGQDPAEETEASEFSAGLRSEVARLTQAGIFTPSSEALPSDAARADDDEVEIHPGGPLAPAGQIAVATQRGLSRSGAAKVPTEARCAPVLNQPIEDWLSGSRVLHASVPEVENDIAFAKSLIVRGFGAEARAVLALSPQSELTLLLAELATLADGAAPAQRVVAMADCSGLASLFAVLADPPTAPSRPGAFIAAFQAFPADLRLTLADRLSEQLRRIGQDEIARMIQSVPAPSSPGSKTPIKAPDHNVPSAGTVSTTLGESVARRTPEAADSIGTLIRNQIATQGEVDDSLMQQAIILSRETQGRTRVNLERAIVEGLISSGRFQEAADRIDGLKARDPDVAKQLITALGDALLSEASDADFLGALVEITGRTFHEPLQRVSLAERALDLGFPKVAGKVLEGRNGIPTRAERILGARVAIASKSWVEARDILSSLSGSDVDTLFDLIPERSDDLTPVQPMPPSSRAPQGIVQRNAKLAAETATIRAEWEAFLSE